MRAQAEKSISLNGPQTIVRRCDQWNKSVTILNSVVALKEAAASHEGETERLVTRTLAYDVRRIVDLEDGREPRTGS